MADIRVASFNTHCGIVPVGRPHPHRYDVAAVLRELDADIIVLQEMLRPDGVSGDADAFAAEHGYELHFALLGRTTVQGPWPRIAPGGEGSSGIAVLTRFPSRRLDNILVGPTPGDPAPRRPALQVDVEAGGRTLRVIGVHLTSRLPHGPPIQLRRLARSLPPSGTPAVLAGDCNFWGPPVTTMLRGWRRAVVGRTWPARAPHSQIDHILVRRGDVDVVAGEVLAECGSDHRPVRAVLRLA